VATGAVEKRDVSEVERYFLEQSGQDLLYEPDEKIGVIVARHFPDLGRLAALRFLEWVSANPEGVVALPTGRTPEYFIKEVGRLLEGWSTSPIQAELAEVGLPRRDRPDLRGLRFVQIDEFYPIDPGHHNSFHYYVNEYYIKGFGLDRDRAMLIRGDTIGLPEGTSLHDVWGDEGVDLSLRFRSPRSAREELQRSVIEFVDQWCCEYERRIRELGGIGFFLGGIGPDGHIGFNIRGSDHNSTTRLAPTNYETQAAAAMDLGGIEVARRRLVITIGLATITYNPDCVAVVMAAGEAKKGVVARSVQSCRHVHYPASALGVLPRARFTVTRGSAHELTARRCALLSERAEVSREEQHRIAVDVSLACGRPLRRLTAADFLAHPDGRILVNRFRVETDALVENASRVLTERLEAGMVAAEGKVFLHTEPHHDDIMLGYLPFVVRHIRVWSNRHHFVTLTSGFNAVTNDFMLEKVAGLKRFVEDPAFAALARESYFDPSSRTERNRDVWQYLDGVAAADPAQQEEGEMRRLTRDLIEIDEQAGRREAGRREAGGRETGSSLANRLARRAEELQEYFRSRYPGQRDVPAMQRLKGMCREWESDCLWGYFGWNADSVHHLRLGFYKGEIFTEEPEVSRDVVPILELLHRVEPDVVTVAVDPEASGPDTHYKVLQALNEALAMYARETGRTDIEVLGYRNVWYRFHPAEADLFVPVSLNMFALQQSAFMHTFISQKSASFPSHEHDGPFSELAQKIQVEQYQMLKTCLGRSAFHEHSSALIRASRGMVFMRRMSLEEFSSLSRRIREQTEAVDA